MHYIIQHLRNKRERATIGMTVKLKAVKVVSKGNDATNICFLSNFLSNLSLIFLLQFFFFFQLVSILNKFFKNLGTQIKTLQLFIKQRYMCSLHVVIFNVTFEI